MPSWGGVVSAGGGRDCGLIYGEFPSKSSLLCVHLVQFSPVRSHQTRWRQEGEDLNMCDYVPLLCYRLLITVHCEFHLRRGNATSSSPTMLKWWGECECVILRVRRRQQVCLKLSGFTCLACMDMVAHREHTGSINSHSQAELQHTIGAYYENIQNQIFNINFSRCQETTGKLIKMMWTMRRRRKEDEDEAEEK